MRIAIVAAMDKELELLLQLMPDNVKDDKSSHRQYTGHIGDHTVLLAKCGIGKVNSALRTQRIINEFKPDLVINSGVAGGADVSAPIGTVLVADRVGYHDVWCGPGTELGEADGCPLEFAAYEKGMEVAENLKQIFPGLQTGMIASGDMFISKPEEIDHIKSIYADALACDMESASIAHTCFVNDVPFMVVRVISDMPGSGNNIAEYTNFWSEAPEKTFHVVEELLNKIG